MDSRALHVWSSSRRSTLRSPILRVTSPLTGRAKSCACGRSCSIVSRSIRAAAGTDSGHRRQGDRQKFTGVSEQGVCDFGAARRGRAGRLRHFSSCATRDAFTFERLKFLVQRFEPPRLAKRIELDRKLRAGRERLGRTERPTRRRRRRPMMPASSVADRGQGPGLERARRARRRGRAIYRFSAQDRGAGRSALRRGGSRMAASSRPRSSRSSSPPES
jgi:hypothetical protein